MARYVDCTSGTGAHSMAYEHDIFLSYTHDEQMEEWVHKHFVPFLRPFVGNALNRPISVFIDRQGINSGDSWPLRLRRALACSRCLIPIWTPLYFHSDWCVRECGVMLLRETKMGLRSLNKPYGLLAPISVFDGNFFPDKARKIQWLDCHNYWVVGEGFSRTERYVEYQDKLRRWSSQVATVIQQAPPWDESWLNDEWFSPPLDELTPKAADNFAFAGLE